MPFSTCHDLEMLALIILRAFYAQRQILTHYMDILLYIYTVCVLGYVTNSQHKVFQHLSKSPVSFSIVQQKTVFPSSSLKLY